MLLDGWKLKVNGPRLSALSQLDDGEHQVELFHLADDPREQQNLRDQEPEKVKELAKRLIAHRSLQPEDSVPPYNVGSKGFVPPHDWKLDPQFPERLVGRHQ